MASQLEGQTFPKEPLTVDWNRQKTATRGDGREMWSGFWELDMTFPILTTTEYNFFFGRFETGSFVTLKTTSPNDQNELTYTGVVIQLVDGQEFDIPGYFNNVVAKFRVPR